MMGRLIDGDKLLRSVKLHYIKKVVSEQKTVEAIPVPWIEKYIADCGVDGTVTMLSAKAVNTMLEEWREEQKDAGNYNK
jgi:hypothetical protein